MAGLTAVSGCVVTDKIEFREPVNSPPAFVLLQTQSAIQLGQILYVDKDTGGIGWKFPFRLRDADVDQYLDAKWRILRKPSDSNNLDPDQLNEKRFKVEVPPNGTDTRDFLIDVTPEYLEFDNCHRIEIAVSGSFVMPNDEDGEPGFLSRTDTADFAMFSFWLWEGDSSAPAAAKLVETCYARSFQPAVPTGAGGTTGMAGEGGL